MIRFVSGDMFERDFDVRVNTVNCVGVMGAGVALAFKQRYPEMFREYKRECDTERLQPGKLHTWENLQGDRIVNFPTKRHWREMSRYEDIEAGLKALRAYLSKLGRVSVAVPALGCGHGGLDWTRVSKMIERELDGLEAEISVFEPGDSRRIGREARASEAVDESALAEAGVRMLSATDPDFPQALRNEGFNVLFAKGDESISRPAQLAVLLAFKPEEREVNAATQCAAAVGRKHVTVSVSSTSRAARNLIEAAIAAGSDVIAWLPEGMLVRKMPEWVEEHVRAKRMLLLSTVAPTHQWSPRYAKEAGVSAAALADAVLVSDPTPTWLPTLPNARRLGRANRLFHLNYGKASAELATLLSEIGSTPISRASNNQPGVQPILAAMQRQHSLDGAVHAATEAVDVKEAPSMAEASGKPAPKLRTGAQQYLIDVEPDNLLNLNERAAEATGASASNGKRKAKKNGANGFEPPNLAKAIRLPVPDFSDPKRRKTCLEVDFPIAPINALSKLEGNAGKPIYQMSKWWARRRSSIFRAMLIAAGTEAPDNPEEAAKLVWDHYYCNHQKAGSFRKLRVLDPFMGGGTTLVEGSRLGFKVTGVDLNPVAWFIVKNELACSDPTQVKAFFDEIEAEVKPQIQPFYTTTCPRGHKGRWIDVRTDQPAPADIDPINLAPEERKHYRWQGPEVIYTFWAKHGPCAGSQGQPCGHRTPIFRSPVIAEKKLTAYYLPIDCPACGYQFHAELGETRMAPGAERVIVDNETPFTELTQSFAQELKDYSKGAAMEKRERVERLLAAIEAEPGFKCPHCQAFTGEETKRVLARHAKTSTRVGDIKKKDFGIESKHVFMYLLIDPKWFEGAPATDDEGREYGGWAGAEPEATARWWRKRLEGLNLIEVRGRVKLADDATANGEPEDDATDEGAEEGGGDEGETETDRKKFGPPARITLRDGRVIDTRKGTVPGKSAFRCDIDGIEQDILTAVAKTGHTPPVVPYALQCHCPACDEDGFNYSGRYFASPSDFDIQRLNAAESEWQSRRNGELSGHWPTSECWDAYMMRANGGVNRGWGYTHWWKMFNSRQLVAHATLGRVISEASVRFPTDIGEQVLGTFQQYLRNQNMFVFWNPQRDTPEPMFSNANYHPKQQVVENGVFNALGRGNWASSAAKVVDALQWAREPWEIVPLPDGAGKKSDTAKPEDPLRTEGVELACQSSTALGDRVGIDLAITDPPFGNNLFYGDLSDFFYVWMRLPLLKWYEGAPERAYFEPERTPRAIEAVQNSVEHPDDREPWGQEPLVTERWLATIRQHAGDDSIQEDEGNPLYRREPAAQFYCDTLTACWSETGRVLKPGGIMAFTFHHSADAPWVDVLEALFNAGFILEATYPIRSDETKGETAAFGSKKIEYDIIHVCRKRLENPEPVAWAKMRRWVKDEAARYKTLLEHVHGRALNAADVRVILIGKSLEFYSQHYGQVFTGEGQVLQVREALLGINQLLDDLLAAEPGARQRPPECEPASRLYLSLFQDRDEMSRDELSKTLRGTGVEPNDLQARGWARIVGTKVHALPLDERMTYFTQRGRTRKAALKTDLDQAHFLIGAARDNSGLSIDRELDNWAGSLKRSTDAILKWYAETARESHTKEAATRAIRLVEAWRSKPRRVEAEQMTLFSMLEQQAEGGAA